MLHIILLYVDQEEITELCFPFEFEILNGETQRCTHKKLQIKFSLNEPRTIASIILRSPWDSKMMLSKKLKTCKFKCDCHRFKFYEEKKSLYLLLSLFFRQLFPIQHDKKNNKNHNNRNSYHQTLVSLIISDLCMQQSYFLYNDICTNIIIIYNRDLY